LGAAAADTGADFNFENEIQYFFYIRVGSRVTRFGDFSTIGRLFTLAIKKTIEESQK
jgi:hypothetical protein